MDDLVRITMDGKCGMIIGVDAPEMRVDCSLHIGKPFLSFRSQKIKPFVPAEFLVLNIELSVEKAIETRDAISDWLEKYPDLVKKAERRRHAKENTEYTGEE